MENLFFNFLKIKFMLKKSKSKLTTSIIIGKTICNKPWLEEFRAGN
jgi:hypothetical protein